MNPNDTQSKLAGKQMGAFSCYKIILMRSGMDFKCINKSKCLWMNADIALCVVNRQLFPKNNVKSVYSRATTNDQ